MEPQLQLSDRAGGGACAHDFLLNIQTVQFQEEKRAAATNLRLALAGTALGALGSPATSSQQAM